MNYREFSDLVKWSMDETGKKQDVLLRIASKYFNRENKGHRMVLAIAMSRK